jgi:hypothetical protein
MSVLLQQMLVGVLVIACALFAAWRLSSVRLRLRALDRLGAWPGLRRASWLVRLRERTRARELLACGGCAGARRDGTGPNRTPGALRR